MSSFASRLAGWSHRWRLAAFAVVTLGLAALGWVRHSHPESAVVYPANAWPRKAPAEEGLDAAGLDKLSALVGGAGCVTRNGFLVYEWGFYRTPMDVASAGKAITSYFVLKAVEMGLIPSLDSPVSDFEPALATLDAPHGFKNNRISWRHMIDQTACYGEGEEPGQAFDYNDFTLNLLWRTLFRKVYKVGPQELTEKVLKPLLATPLGFEDEAEYYQEKNQPYVGRLIISARDFCRFGYLFMQHGQWRGQQILTDKMARMAVSTPLPNALPRTRAQATLMLPGQMTLGGGSNQEEHCGSYSCLWWMNGVDGGGRRLWPDAPPDTYGAFGYGGNRALIVIPSTGIVACWTKSDLPVVPMSGAGRKKVNEAIQALMQATHSKQ